MQKGVSVLMTALPTDFLGRILFFVDKYAINFLRGAGTTMIIALAGTSIGCVIGFIVGILQTIPISKKDSVVKKCAVYLIRGIMNIYVEVFRGTPMMVQAMFIFYGIAQYCGIVMNMWFAAILIVSINTGAYMAETVRGGIISVDPGQTEGAKAIGMTHYQTMVYVILPQAFRNILPQIGNNLIINIKDTCVLSVISVVELFFQTKSVTGAYYLFFEPFTITMIVYLFLTVACSRLLRLLEKKLDGNRNYDLATTDTLMHTSGMIRFGERKGNRDGK